MAQKAPPPEPAVPGFPEFTKRQITYTSVVAFLAWTFAVYDLITFGNLLPMIRNDFSWTASTASFVATAISAASVLMALTVGPVIDLLGRKKALLMTTGGAAVSSSLAALAMGPITLTLARSLSGFGIAEQSVNAAERHSLARSARSEGSSAPSSTVVCFALDGARPRRRRPASLPASSPVC
jgi:MFS family permease